VPSPLQLELHDGHAWVSLVGFTMSSFRSYAWPSSTAWLRWPIASQSFLNVRTYVRCGDESGALFLWGWLSQPFRVALPSGLFGLPYAFASLEYRHQDGQGDLRGAIADSSGRLVYHARLEPPTPLLPCTRGTLADFALERYTGWFQRGRELRVFRAWHPPWLQASIEVTIEDHSLVTGRFPWLKDASHVSANYAPGFAGVRLGIAHRVPRPKRTRRSVLSAFFEMP
jgi:uncharacterized protein YqjF (DUF2071 family)